MWRRAVVSAAAMLGASAAFVGVVMLVLMFFVDRAVGPDHARDTTRASDTTAAEQPAKPASDGETSETTPSETGERS